ncbi:MAG TPA: ATP-binding cassette domain-containing protein, partial [Micromonosporaceae bacterium]
PGANDPALMSATRDWWRSPLPWLGGLLAIYLLSPIGDFLGRLATARRIASPGTGAALAVSAETATLATLIIALFGIPLAYLLARGRSRGSAVIGVAVQLPIALPPLISGIMLLYLVGPYSAVGRIFGGRLTDDRAGIVLAQVFVAAPFLVVAARSAFAAIDPSFDDVAATLGHRPWSRFARVAVPIATPGIVAGLMLAWLRAFGEFGATVVLAYHPYSLPVFSYVQFGSTGLAATMLPTAAALGAAVVVLLLTAAASRRRLTVPTLVSGPTRIGPTGEIRMQPRPPQLLSFDVHARAGQFSSHSIGRTAGCLALIGATGAGKTLTLRSLAGVQRDSTGSALLGERDLTGTPAECRNVGYVPQESCLLPHLPVRQQVEFAIGTDPVRAAFWLDRLDLDALADRRPEQLSGGQRRRVALARALAADPDLLLLDEPLSGLDTPSRTELRRMLRVLLAEHPLTTVLVTHDPEDIAMLADDVCVLDRGVTLRHGPRDQVYREPGGLHAARLLGISNALPARVVDRGRVRTADGTMLPADTDGWPVNAAVLAIIDPSAVAISARHRRRAEVTDVIDFPDRRVINVRLGAHTALVVHRPLSAAEPVPILGDLIGLELPATAVRLSARDG